MITDLTTREMEVLKLIAVGQPNKAMAAELHISIKTVEKHRQTLLRKLRLNHAIPVVHYARCTTNWFRTFMK